MATGSVISPEFALRVVPVTMGVNLGREKEMRRIRSITRSSISHGESRGDETYWTAWRELRSSPSGQAVRSLPLNRGELLFHLDQAGTSNRLPENGCAKPSRSFRSLQQSADWSSVFGARPWVPCLYGTGMSVDSCRDHATLGIPGIRNVSSVWSRCTKSVEWLWDCQRVKSACESRNGRMLSVREFAESPIALVNDPIFDRSSLRRGKVAATWRGPLFQEPEPTGD